MPLQVPGAYVLPYGNVVLLAPWHPACHSAAVQSRQFGPSRSQAASASDMVTLAQGSLPGTEQPRLVESNPALVLVAS